MPFFIELWHSPWIYLHYGRRGGKGANAFEVNMFVSVVISTFKKVTVIIPDISFLCVTKKMKPRYSSQYTK